MDGDFGPHADASGEGKVAKSAVDVQRFLAQWVGAVPARILPLDGAPLEPARNLDSELHAMGVPA